MRTFDFENAVEKLTYDQYQETNIWKNTLERIENKKVCSKCRNTREDVSIYP